MNILKGCGCDRGQGFHRGDGVRRGANIWRRCEGVRRREVEVGDKIDELVGSRCHSAERICESAQICRVGLKILTLSLQGVIAGFSLDHRIGFQVGLGLR